MHHRILCIILYVNILNNKTLVGSSILQVSFSIIHNQRIIVNNEPGKVEKVVTVHSKEPFQNLFEMWRRGVTDKINNDPSTTI